MVNQIDFIKHNRNLNIMQSMYKEQTSYLIKKQFSMILDILKTQQPSS